MKDLVAKNEFHVALLDGVTGSGKTEVYFEAVAENIKRGRQTMILMPEIALTGQFLDRFASRFGVRPIEWHSELTPRTRARNWAAVASGDAPVVVGARSALFLPYAISASSLSMKNTIRLTSRMTARIITRATWPWCAVRLRKFRWCCVRQRRRSIRSQCAQGTL
jgi:hypothetical protein